MISIGTNKFMQSDIHSLLPLPILIVIMPQWLSISNTIQYKTNFIIDRQNLLYRYWLLIGVWFKLQAQVYQITGY